jgi:signal transduction histidine kinase/ActR/RegA family two-component response regulator
MNRQRLILSLLLAVASSVLALVLTRTLGEFINPIPSVLFLASVVLSTWLGGFSAGIAALVVSTLGLASILPEATPETNFARLGLFMAIGTLICSGNGALRWSRGRIEQSFHRVYALHLGLTREREMAQAKAAEQKLANEQLRGMHERSLYVEQELRDQQGELSRAYDELREQQENLTFLLGASTLLSESLDYERNLITLARLSVPKMGDWCAIDLVREGEAGSTTLFRLTIQHHDPQAQALLVEMARRYPHRSDAASGPAHVVNTGKEELISEVTEAHLAAMAEDEEQLRMLRQLGLKSAMILPLAARGRRLGAISFYSSHSGRRFGLTDLNLGEDLARRAAFAVDNAQLYEQVRVADRRKDEFLATLAHELRNPLAPIMSAFEILRQRGGGHPELEDLHETVRRQIQHLVRLIDDLVDVSRITRGKVDLKRERVRLETLVHQAVDTSQPWLESRSQQLVLRLSQEPLWVIADPARMLQVIANLLNNASKYTHPRGCVWLTTERDGDHAILSVRDNGAGIAPDILPHVFDLFTQGDRSLDRSQGGLGIGLTLVRSLVEHHRGEVEAFSGGPGRGSEFVVRLPLAVEKTAELTREPARAPAAAGPARSILIVEDQRDARETLRRLLELDGHRVNVAEDGPTGLEQIFGLRPEVALVDVGLPRMDGYELAARVRREIGASIQLIALTGYGNREDRQRALLAGFDDHLVKPVDLDRLRRILRPNEEIPPVDQPVSAHPESPRAESPHAASP